MMPWLVETFFLEVPTITMRAEIILLFYTLGFQGCIFLKRKY